MFEQQTKTLEEQMKDLYMNGTITLQGNRGHGGIYVRRVPGGLLYEYESVNAGVRSISTGFVPFTEFNN